jgi:uncharacterized membrane protein YqiK
MSDKTIIFTIFLALGSIAVLVLMEVYQRYQEDCTNKKNHEKYLAEMQAAEKKRKSRLAKGQAKYKKDREKYLAEVQAIEKKLKNEK